MQTVYTTYTTVVTEKKTNWKIRKPRTSRENRDDIISTACTRCWQPIRKRIGISCLYALVFSEDNIGGKSETGSTLIGNGFAKEFKRVF